MLNVTYVFKASASKRIKAYQRISPCTRPIERARATGRFPRFAKSPAKNSTATRLSMHHFAPRANPGRTHAPISRTQHARDTTRYDAFVHMTAPSSASSASHHALLADPRAWIQTMCARACAAQSPATTPVDGDWGVQDVMRELTSDADAFDAVMELNSHSAIETIAPNTLVRFRGLVQDMYEPEYYVGAYLRSDGTWITTKYGEHQGMIEDGCETVLFERRVIYCVPVPGEREWVREADAAAQPAKAAVIHDGTGAQERVKRSRDDESMDVCDDGNRRDDTINGGVAMKIKPDIERVQKTSAVDKLAPDTPEQIGEGEPREESLDQLLNFPLVPETRSPCIVKLYGDSAEENLKLNDVVEFVGLMYYAPELGAGQDDSMENGGASLPFQSSSFPEEEASRNPATSLVPRFHALSYKVTSVNELAQSTPAERFAETEAEPKLKITPEQCKVARAKILDMLTHALGGDVFAAELVLMVLISKVHTRTETLTLGKFSLNLSGCKIDAREQLSLSEALSSVIAMVCPANAHLPFTVPALNARSWTPKKDYVFNRLRAGPLQLAASTVLVLDETILEAGTLTETGIRNIDALKALTTLQDLEYDFQYHQMRMPVDVPVIIASDTKSIIPVDVVLPLRRVRAPKVVAATEEELTLIRKFIAGMRMMKHIISEETSKAIEAEIVSARQADTTLTQDALHRMLTMARLHALSQGTDEVTAQTWKKTVEINRRIAERARVV